jgi:hypothetical protein
MSYKIQQSIVKQITNEKTIENEFYCLEYKTKISENEALHLFIYL